jgi:TolA-binding protein
MQMKWIAARFGLGSATGSQPNRHRSKAFLVLLLCWFAPASRADAQDAAETRAFRDAVRTFQIGIYDRAARELGEFVNRYPGSSYRPEAVLLQGRAALNLKNFGAAIDLLSTNAFGAGRLADEYRHLLGEAHFQAGDFRAATAAFASLIRDFTNSARLLEASYGEARARFRLKEWRQTAELLENPNGTFQRVAAIRGSDELAVSGRLLLAEALLEAREFSRAEAAVSAIPEADLIPEFKWRRQYLLCRIQLADQRPQDALANTTNLLALATATGQRNLEAESVAMHGEILRRAGKLEAAAQVYGKNLAEEVSLDHRRRALLNIIRLALIQDKVDSAERQLKTFLTQHPEDSASDVVLLTLGEVHLKHHLLSSQTNAAHHVSTVTASTNDLRQALEQFDLLLKNHTNSSLRGQAQLNRGWCLWLGGRIDESLVAFKTSAELLPYSEEQAMARFKVADTQLQRGDFTNAVQNYRALLNDFRGVPRVRDTLFDRALYQTVRACIQLNDAAGAEGAMRQLLEEYPESSLTDRSMLLVGQNLAQLGEPSEGRAVFSEFSRRFPASPLLPEVELAMARTHDQDGDWPAAIKQYENWLARFATNALRPQAEFYRALAYGKSGQQTQALHLFTNFVARFSGEDTLAPLAQNWVGYYFFEQKDFINAQISFQTLIESTNWPASRLTYEARMMAGLAAYARQAWKDATNHFAAIINDVANSPPDLVAKALFALGDTLIKQDPDPANPLKRFDNAKVAFKRIPDLYPTNPHVPRAWGRIGDCYLQLATSDPKFYADAAESYQKAMQNADVQTRSLAQFGLAQVLERQAKLVPDGTAYLKDAFDHYYDIVSRKNLRDGEQPDAYSVKEAGLNAARIKEERGEWAVANNIYEMLGDMIPSLRPALERKRQRVAPQLQSDKD